MRGERESGRRRQPRGEQAGLDLARLVQLAPPARPGIAGDAEGELPGGGREELEVGYLLARRCWGQGYATEALRAVVAAAFAELGVERVVAATAVENTRSARVLERAGLRWESLLRAHARGRGKRWDVNVYCIGRDDWLSANAP